MGFRFRRRLPIIPGLWLNLSKSGVSASVGGRGFTENIGPRGHQETISAIGTGLSYRTKRRPIGTRHRPAGRRAMSQAPRRGFWSWLFWGDGPEGSNPSPSVSVDYKPLTNGRQSITQQIPTRILVKNPSGGYHPHRNIFRSAPVEVTCAAVRKAFQKAAGSGRHIAESKSRRRDLNPQSPAEEVV